MTESVKSHKGSAQAESDFTDREKLDRFEATLRGALKTPPLSSAKSHRKRRSKTDSTDGPSSSKRAKAAEP
jgi:hypothetical protein